ncbi:PH domain-containing protein [Pseudonocardia asaccharolytica]|uniref:Membrane protein n=1 Tax=Pseudonocardia asaccharolytica DSM 44247 = NBRC 16224 TaxID=1123024 RepID=A0A511D4Y3_9PSEU|nr:PH domain-containing protein [Pseudonocardia asaccharolytica]GEL19717.1 membrane protein [Pseudonocardia asaccharolytica DSM 44247 = NBRC 16224]
MAYPDGLLVDGERVVLHEHPHWKMLVVPVLVFLVTVGAGGYLAALVRNQNWGRVAWIALAAVGMLIVGWLTVVPFVRWRTTHFVVTTHRVLVREGVLSRQGIDIPMSRINSVQFRHTLVERLLRCGTLVIESASDEPLEFDDVPDVEKVHATLYHEVADDA